MGWIHSFFGLLDAPENNGLGPKAPRPPTPGLNLPPGTWIPDHKLYKVEDAPELLTIQKRLAARGLKSPWLRHEVWRYNRKMWGSEYWRRYDFITQGWKYAIPALIVTWFYEAYVKKDDGHGHGGGHGHDEHKAGGHH